MNVTEVLVNAWVVITSQYINASNQYVIHLKLKQCYISIKLKKFKKKRKETFLTKEEMYLGRTFNDKID